LIAWWEDKFLPTVAEAFSCGFTDADTFTEEEDLLPSDIRTEFRNGNLTIQRVWRLVKGYLRSHQKQREKFQRQPDFDVSLYVPFLKVPLSRVYMGLQNGNNNKVERRNYMRASFPSYAAPSTWWLWHTMAARTAELERTCGISGKKILDAYKILLTYFGTTHPCPHCREHFMSRLSRNDRDWESLGKTSIALDPIQSEANLYPLEWLFLGGTDRIRSSSLMSKLNSIKDGKTFMLFVWKLHNALSTATYYNLQCKDSELVDEEPYNCYVNETTTPRYSHDGYASTVSLGRAWPTVKRFEFWRSLFSIWRFVG